MRRGREKDRKKVMSVIDDVNEGLSRNALLRREKEYPGVEIGPFR